MEQLLKYFRVTFYTDPLFTLVCCICLLASLNLKNKHKVLDVFRYYFGAFTILKFLEYSTYFTSSEIGDIVYTHADYVFTIFEYFIFSFFFKSFRNDVLGRLINILTVAFLIIALFLLAWNLYSQALITTATKDILFTIQAV